MARVWIVRGVVDAELAEKEPPDTAEVAAGSVQMHESTTSPFAHRGKLRLVTRAALDNRTTAAKLFDKTVTEITADLGGTESLSQIERSLIDAYAGASLMVNHMTARMIEGEQISLTRYSAAVGALVRIATRLGIKRRVPHGETLTLGAYLSDRPNEPPDPAETDDDAGAP
jgi:hypothetical protein